MRYPIAIETGDAEHAYGVVVPDLPGCFSAGDTLDEALANSGGHPASCGRSTR
jgi:predicted RNase H-like HicB family nuclease